jgi:hypothetical protein
MRVVTKIMQLNSCIRVISRLSSFLAKSKDIAYTTKYNEE